MTAPSKRESQNNLKSAFKAVVQSNLKEWDMASELTDGKGAITREFEHRATKDKVRVVETTKYDPCDEMDVTYMNVSGSHKGRDVKGFLIIKPMID